MFRIEYIVKPDYTTMLDKNNCDLPINNCEETVTELTPPLTANDSGYRGTQTRTSSGALCVAWDNYPVEELPAFGTDGGHNFCRNPNNL